MEIDDALILNARESDIYDQYPFYDRTDLADMIDAVRIQRLNMRIILLGSNGMLGRYVHKLCVESKSCNEVVCITRCDFDFGQSSDTVVQYLSGLIQLNDVVINCIGMINKRESVSAEEQLQFFRINAVLPRLLAQVCYNNGGFLVHITTDCVYDGTGKGWMCQMDPHNSIDIYGMTKSLGDMAVKGYPMVALLRTSIIGEDSNNRSLVEWVINEKNRAGSSTIPGYTNHRWNGITCLKLAEIIVHAIYIPITDLSHRYCTQANPMVENPFFGKETIIVSDRAVRKYDLINTISKVYNIPYLVIPVEAPIEKNMQLSGTLKCKDSIEIQIQKMYEFDVLNRRSI